MAPQRRVSARVSALPAPELVSLPDGPIDPQTAVQAPWWAEYGGVLDASGTVRFPRHALPRCRFDPCPVCDRRRRNVPL
jgi:hypothetical protein